MYVDHANDGGLWKRSAQCNRAIRKAKLLIQARGHG
jgi:hypothetical protein